ncbi:hypothetical protein [Helicobacter sp. MIT 05-5294]|uniref:hypothetical protein n=1 Tax=Helicobacter sp. MIT 05-5294 TaxID=1548150 RepID=UPI00051F9EDC|nr:hypothetical protein [Helicobacter sp. MIT 05-5294]TLD85549.1 hypothetical protein LS69_008860 [Helicobacter sp. MIT 05-5294]
MKIRNTNGKCVGNLNRDSEYNLVFNEEKGMCEILENLWTLSIVNNISLDKELDKKALLLILNFYHKNLGINLGEEVSLIAESEEEQKILGDSEIKLILQVMDFKEDGE